MRFAVLSFLLLGCVLMGCSRTPGPVIVVKASYSGANAQATADLVAVPIEQQVNGVEGMRMIESESRNDGSYVARVRIGRNFDLNMVQILVQNRVALAQPMLPEAVRKAGIVVAIEPPMKDEGVVVDIAIIDRGNRDAEALRILAETVMKKLLAEKAIRSAAVFPGPEEKRVNVEIDRKKCSEYGIAISEISKKIESAGQDAGVEKLKSLSVTAENGDSIAIDKVAKIELADVPSSVFRFDLRRAIRITGLPPEGESTKAASARCVELVKQELKSHKDAVGVDVIDLTVP